MQLGALSPEQRGRLGYGDEDVIPVSSVGAYLFDTSGPVPGNVVKELSVEDSDGIPGIPDDQYADVSKRSTTRWSTWNERQQEMNPVLSRLRARLGVACVERCSKDNCSLGLDGLGSR